MGILGGITIAEKSHRKPPPTDSELRDRLIVAENLNTSLKRDLNEAKEELWKLKDLNKSKDTETKNGKLK